MKKKKLCIVIPIYKEILTINEDLSVKTVLEKFKNIDIYFITFRNLNLSFYQKYKTVKIKYFPQRFFASKDTYNRLLLNPIFYRKFIQYCYMCIIQTDVFVLGTEKQLKQFVSLGYDYIGAPWKKAYYIHRFEPDDKFGILELFPFIKEKLLGNGNWCFVGNGGLSLRNIRKTIKLLEKYWLSRITWYKNEDVFFAYFGIYDNEYKLAPFNVARRFSLETTTRIDMSNGIIPFGVHAWEKYCPELLEKIK